MPANVRAMFAVSMTTSVGDGKTTAFWTDRWLHGKSVQDLAPALMPFVRKRGWRKLTVSQAMENNGWTKYIVGGLNVVAVWQFLQLWQAVNEITLSPEVADQHRWLAHSSGAFTTKSAYEHYFVGATKFEPYKRLWKCWAPLRVKMFIWLAILNRCWTADRLQRRGLDHPDCCPLCVVRSRGREHTTSTHYMRLLQRSLVPHTGED